MLKIILGEQSSLAINSTRADSSRLLESGYKFKFIDIKDALKEVYSSSRKDLLNTQIFIQKQWLACDIESLWEFFTNPSNLEEITLPWLKFKIVTMPRSVVKGSTISYVWLHGIPIKWTSLISKWEPKSYFVDEQLKGPYKIWHHQHILKPLKNGTLCIDIVNYRIPFSFLSNQTIGGFILKDIEKIFSYRKNFIKNF